MMNWKTLRTRAAALSLAAVLSVTLTLPAGAVEPIGSGVTPTYDEAYYADRKSTRLNSSH